MTKASRCADDPKIRPLGAQDEAAWKELWRQYANEVGESTNAVETDRAWSILMDPDLPLHGLGASVEGSLAGFLLYAPIPYPWGTGSACYLVDIGVNGAFRRRGVAWALIKVLAGMGLRNEWRHIFWLADPKNPAACRLYDQIGRRSELVRYEMTLAPELSRP